MARKAREPRVGIGIKLPFEVPIIGTDDIYTPMYDGLCLYVPIGGVFVTLRMSRNMTNNRQRQRSETFCVRN